MIVFDHVTKRYAKSGFTVEDLNFDVREGEILILLGKSGSGKTTALRLINRLIDPTSGTITLGGVDIQTLDPVELRRKIGYAIQHIGLFPHMNVAENIAIVPKLLGWNEEQLEARVDDLLEMVGLNPSQFRTMMPSNLSGGQKQRIGVARCLAADPPVILMDEPFGALDPMMREQLQNEFLEIQKKIHKTIVFVTHDLSEAVKLGDRIAVLEGGKLIQIGTPEELIERPASDFIDSFLGKDRFLLMLRAKALEEMRGEFTKGARLDEHPLQLKSSLMEALAAFKESGSQHLSVFDESEKHVGNLSLDRLMNILVDRGGTSALDDPS